MKKKRAESVPNYTDIIAGLKDIYKSKIKPVEQLLSFDQFSTPSLTDADLTAKPIVLLMGQYSVGKSTFIKYILEKEYPGCHIGPEPTTDRFIAILGGEDRIIPGNAAAVDRDLPFTSLSRFGASFLQKFQVSYTSSPILESVTLIDTPGVLSGEKQRIGRSYDFSGVMEYFAARADAILLLFDAHKLDISDEFKDCIMGLKGNEEKVKVILNKADMVNGQQLLRVYGALMWSLGKVLNTPEVMRVYIGSFWDQPLRYRDCEALLSAEQEDLLADLRSLSTNSTMRKINDIVKRASMVKIHALIISHLKQEMPGFFGKSSKQSELLANLAAEFTKLEHLHRLPRGDFPNVEEFKSKLSLFKIDKFPKLDKKLMATLDTAISVDLPELIKRFPQNTPTVPQIFQNPFENFASVEGTHETLATPSPEQLWNWESIDRKALLNRFAALSPVDGKLSGAVVRPVLQASQLDNGTLAKIWKLADWTQDGYLDSDEFIVAMWLAEIKTKGWAEIPDALPPTLVPHRRF